MLKEIGLFVIAFLTIRLVWYIYTAFFKAINLSPYSSKSGERSWAVITGATDGIGLGFAKVLAREGFNILLVSRNLEKLTSVKSQLLEEYKVKVEMVVSEASDPSLENVNKVSDKIIKDKLDVAILVNNVGIDTGGKPGKLHDVPFERCTDLVNVNCLYPTLLTRSIIPYLLTRQSRKSLIINISSVAGLIPLIPRTHIYSASKAYNRFFSLGLSADYHSAGIDVLSVEPGFVQSNMSKLKESPVCCSAVECAEGSLRRATQIDIIPHWKHLFFYWFSVLFEAVPFTVILPPADFLARKLMQRLFSKKPKVA